MAGLLRKPAVQALMVAVLSVVACVAFPGADCALGDAPSGFAEVLRSASDRLQDSGLTVEPVYYGEVFTNARGGKSTNQATRYLGLLDLAATIDLERSAFPGRGTVFVLGQNTHGRGITEDFIGDAQVLSNIDSFDNIAQVSEYWWQFDLLEGDVTVRAGKQDVNTEFLFIDMAADYIQSTFGLSPSTAFPTYPDPSMGVVALVQLSESWRLKTGLWDAFAPGSGWGFSGNDSILVAGELEHAYALGRNGLPGVLAVGAVYESEGEFEGTLISAVQEYYVQLEQALTREAGSGDQGLGVFVGYYPRIPGRLKTAESVGDSAVGGIIYRGLLPSRDDDVLGFGFAWIELFGGGTGEESVCELFYKATLTPTMHVQPDLQYIASPSGVFPDALACGVRVELRL